MLINKLKVFLHHILPIESNDFLLTNSTIQLVITSHILIYLIAFITPQMFWVYTLVIGVYTLLFGVVIQKSSVSTLQMGVATQKTGVVTLTLGVDTKDIGVYTQNPCVVTHHSGVDTQNFRMATQMNHTSIKSFIPILIMIAVARMSVQLHCNFGERLNMPAQLAP